MALFRYKGKIGLRWIVLIGTGLSMSNVWAQNPNAGFEAYTTCKLNKGPQVVDVAPLAPGIKERTVNTSHGLRRIPMEAGRRVMFAYPDKDFYANVKVEILPAQNYADTKQSLIDNFDYILATSPGTERNYALKPMLNGLDVRGLDRQKLEGGVLGIYLLIDDATHTVSTIYFLNQEPKDRSFQTIEEYRTQREQFLTGYATCAHASGKK